MPRAFPGKSDNGLYSTLNSDGFTPSKIVSFEKALGRIYDTMQKGLLQGMKDSEKIKNKWPHINKLLKNQIKKGVDWNRKYGIENNKLLQKIKTLIRTAAKNRQDNRQGLPAPDVVASSIADQISGLVQSVTSGSAISDIGSFVSANQVN